MARHSPLSSLWFGNCGVTPGGRGRRKCGVWGIGPVIRPNDRSPSHVSEIAHFVSGGLEEITDMLHRITVGQH
jgi:hypothetical protein